MARPPLAPTTSRPPSRRTESTSWRPTPTKTSYTVQTQSASHCLLFLASRQALRNLIAFCSQMSASPLLIGSRVWNLAWLTRPSHFLLACSWPCFWRPHFQISYLYSWVEGNYKESGPIHASAQLGLKVTDPQRFASIPFLLSPHPTKAVIVRIMKSRKTLEHNQLVMEARRCCPTP